NSGALCQWTADCGACFHRGHYRGGCVSTFSGIDRTDISKKINLKTMDVKKVVVVGATGNLGSKIVKSLIEQGAAVTAMVRATSNRTKLEQLGVRNFVVGDLMDKASLSEALSPYPPYELH